MSKSKHRRQLEATHNKQVQQTQEEQIVDTRTSDWNEKGIAIFKFPFSGSMTPASIFSYCNMVPINTRTFPIDDTDLLVIVEHTKLIIVDTSIAKVILCFYYNSTIRKGIIIHVKDSIFLEVEKTTPVNSPKVKYIFRLVVPHLTVNKNYYILQEAIENHYPNVPVSIDDLSEFNESVITDDLKAEHQFTYLFRFYALVNTGELVELDTDMVSGNGKLFTWDNVEAMAVKEISYPAVIGYFLEGYENDGSDNFRIMEGQDPDVVVFFKGR